MPRIIVNALQKRNETGLVSLSASGAGENVACSNHFCRSMCTKVRGAIG